jgi:hypothetical protein
VSLQKKITFNTLTSDGVAVITSSGETVFGWNGRRRSFYIEGDFNGGTLYLQHSIDESTWRNSNHGYLTQNGELHMNTQSSPGPLWRFNLLGSTSPSIDITMYDATES